MTRQLSAQSRLDQLSDASIPFKYYPCAIIFTDDAFELETKLHRRLAEYKVNKLNQRKEHFIIDKLELLDVLNNEFNLNVQFDEIIDEDYIYSIDNGLQL
jgi:RNA processing factor Prp31